MYEQKIYFGAPGTGKSFLIDKKLKELNISDDKIFRTVIHPEYSYCDFVGQLLPVNEQDISGEQKTVFKFKQGPFTRALAEAYSDSSKEVCLIIEELSRGNVAAIFGDIFQLLDRDSHFVSRYPINNKNIADSIPTIIGDNIKLPSNFNILCTVNTNDQNVFPMDTAFKRRFEWEYVATEPAKKDNSDEYDLLLNNPQIYINKKDGIIKTNWLSFYMSLNSYIVNVMGKNEDKQVGQFFIKFNDELCANTYSDNEEICQNSLQSVNQLIKNKLLLYLWQDVESRNYTSNVQSSLFANGINSYNDLYNKYGKEQIFSESFLSKFLDSYSDLSKI